MTFSDKSAFWIFNQVSNFAYTRTNIINGDILKKQIELEEGYAKETVNIDKTASDLYKKSPAEAVKYLTDYSLKSGNNTFKQWKDLYATLFVKFVDGNVKEKVAVPKNYKYHNPKISQPGYSDEWNRMVVKNTGDKFKEPEVNK